MTKTSPDDGDGHHENDDRDQKHRQTMILRLTSKDDDSEREEHSKELEEGGGDTTPLVVERTDDSGTLDSKKKESSTEAGDEDDIIVAIEKGSQNDPSTAFPPPASLTRYTVPVEPGAYSVTPLTAAGTSSVSGSSGASNTVADAATIASSLAEQEQENQQQQEDQQQQQQQGALLVNAVTVADPEEMEAQIRHQVRQEILSEVVTAHAHKPRRRLSLWTMIGGILLIAVVLSIGLAVGLTMDKNSNSSSDQTMQDDNLLEQGPTYEEVRKRGFIRCGIYNQSYGFSFPNDKTGIHEGMNIDQCRAVALAALGNSSLYETVVVNSRERFKALHAKQIDVLTQTATHTMGRDVFEPSAGVGFSFSVPFMYTGLAFGGVPEMVDCADTLDTLRGSCRQLKICVGLGTTHELILNDLLAATFLVRTNQAQDHISYINNGTCNVIAKDSVALPEVRMRKDGYFGDYKIGRNIFSREPLALATRDNDSEWTDLVNGVVQLFYTVESEKFLTQELATTILQTNKEEEDEDRHITNRVLDVRVVLQIVSEFGHYGELYERNLQGIVPRDTLNLLNINFDSGLLYSFPFGNLDALGSTAPSSSSAGQRSTTLETIQNRGHLICGVIPRHGFADYNHSTGVWTGLDIEFCKSVSAGVLAGANDTVVFVDVGSSNTTSISSPTSSTEQESTAGREASEPTVYSSLQYLRNQTVDLVAGERVSLQKDFLSNVTFSTPYFYDAKEKAAYAFATRPDDSQWSDFVYWIVMATFYAEENNITSASAISMPAVGLFGEQFKPMLFDCISSVGSYGEIYQRIRSSGGPMLEDRAGGNLLNQNLTGPQQVAIPIS